MKAAVLSASIVATATWPSAAAACRGDCDQSGSVTVDELIKGVNIALGSSGVASCPAFDADNNLTVTVDELVAAVNDALNGCVAAGTPTATRSGTASPTPTATPPLTVMWTNRGPDIDYEFGLPVGFAALALDADHMLYAGIVDPVFGVYGVYASPDGGATWTPSTTSTGVYGLLADEPSGVVYAAGRQKQLLKSMNSGMSWMQVGEFPSGSGALQEPADLFVEPTDAQTLYASGGFPVVRVQRSIDGGATWTHPLADQFGQTLFNVVALDPGTPGALYAAGGSFGSPELRRSTDTGATWTPIPISGLAQNEITAIAIDPRAPHTLYAGTKTTVFKSSNGGSNWLPAGTGLPQRIEVLQILIDPTSSQTLYLAKTCNGIISRGGGCVFRSIDGGAHWEDISTGLDFACPSNPTMRCYAEINRLLLDSSSGTLFAGTSVGVYSAAVQ